jgi:hypothetical protein
MNDVMTGEVAAPAADHADEASRAPSKKVLIIGGVVGVLLLAVGGFVVLGGSGGGDEDLGAVPSASQSAAAQQQATGATTPDGAAEAAAPAEPVGEYTDSLGRDPFEPLYPEASGTAEDSTEATTGGAVTTDIGGGTVTTDPGTTGTPVSLTLDDVSAATVAMTIDGKAVTAPTDGTAFGGGFTIYGVFSDRCAGVLNGEDSFVMCEGDSRTVTR